MGARPLPYWPARLGEDMAAEYLGVSKTTFRERWHGRMYPQPVREGRRLLWARLQLDKFVEAQFGLLDAQNDDDPTWSDFNGQG